MSSKIGLILSMFFVALFFLFGMDMISLQFIYSELDAKGVSIAYYIGKNSRIDEDFAAFLSQKYEIEVIIPPSQKHDYGDIVTFYLRQDFDPLVIGKDVMVIYIKREAVIGYYG